jgi:hypothetical protein
VTRKPQFRTEVRSSAASQGQSRLLSSQAQHEREQHARHGRCEDLSVPHALS